VASDFCSLTRQALDRLRQASPWEANVHLFRQVLDRLEVEQLTEGRPATLLEQDVLQQIVNLYDSEVALATQVVQVLDRIYCQGEIRPPQEIGLKGA